LEQIQGLGTDTRSDLYSLGATLYHLMTGVKPPDALTRAAAVVNGQPDPLVKPSEANAPVAPQVDQVLVKAMAQNREQRYPTAADMRKALHGAEQASTVVDRGEAQTVLFPPPPTTVAVPTQTVAQHETVASTGETTVVRPRKRGSVVPIVVSAVVLLLVACGALGYYALRNRNEPVVQQIAAETPTPIGGPVVTVPSPSPEVSVNVPSPEQSAATPKRSPRNEEARKEPIPAPKTTPAPDTEVEHEGEPPDVPVPPNFDPNRRPRPRVRVMPGGVRIHNLPDGSQIITMPDGMRVMVTKDGKRTVLNPPRPNRRQPAPGPTPSP
jgi:serine/threonine protein kinase